MQEMLMFCYVFLNCRLFAL